MTSRPHWWLLCLVYCLDYEVAGKVTRSDVTITVTAVALIVMAQTRGCWSVIALTSQSLWLLLHLLQYDDTKTWMLICYCSDVTITVTSVALIAIWWHKNVNANLLLLWRHNHCDCCCAYCYMMAQTRGCWSVIALTSQSLWLLLSLLLRWHKDVLIVLLLLWRHNNENGIGW